MNNIKKKLEFENLKLFLRKTNGIIDNKLTIKTNEDDYSVLIENPNDFIESIKFKVLLVDNKVMLKGSFKTMVDYTKTVLEEEALEVFSTIVKMIILKDKLTKELSK